MTTTTTKLTPDTAVTIRWTTKDEMNHLATVTLDDVASMLGVPVQEVIDAGLKEMGELGNRGLENGLSEIEDHDTEEGGGEFTRDVWSIKLADENARVRVTVPEPPLVIALPVIPEHVRALRDEGGRLWRAITEGRGVTNRGWKFMTVKFLSDHGLLTSIYGTRLTVADPSEDDYVPKVKP